MLHPFQLQRKRREAKRGGPFDLLMFMENVNDVTPWYNYRIAIIILKTLKRQPSPMPTILTLMLSF